VISCSCGYDCRILFQIRHDETTNEEYILPVDIGTHDDVYYYMSQTILIIDDDRAVQRSIALALKQSGYATDTASSADEALMRLHKGSIDAVIQDMNFSRSTSGEEGLSLLELIKSGFPELPVLLITAWGSVELAVEGMKRGAADFLLKPWSNEELIRRLETALQLALGADSEGKNDEKKQSEGKPALSRTLTRAQLDQDYDFTGIIGEDPKLLAVLSIIGRVAQTEAPVLITGESGSGKELIAEAIVRNSRRRDAPFVRVNMGSITPTLFESELFGHVKGAFTGAVSDRKGRFDHAHGGTIFLDEIGDLDASSQVKLLRVLQERTFEAVGSSITKTVDVRVISATNRHLQSMIERGNFREDLLYRLNLISVHLPPLRERTSDIKILAEHFLQAAGRQYFREGLAIAPEALRWLQSHPFSGNIRELKHCIERTVLLAASERLTAQDFQTALAVESSEHRTGTLPAVGTMTLDEIEKAMILKAVAQFPGNVSRIAEALGLTRQALYRRLEKFGLDVG
jgi:two-component system NtrC family response regulator